ncbi:MAG: hypothetical protein JXP73_01180 [Deltaproteobacteria bacterium]|nr:hypothetical protein [Deltaproteobacteria bacterium]
MAGNHWCEILGIVPPRLEAVKNRPEASSYSLLLVALLERGEPMTLPEVALRFEQAGIAPREQALASLKKSRPARAPVYRDGEQYHLDPHDHDLDLWAFRLGLRPPKVQAPPAAPRPVAPLPAPEVRLSVAELEEAWKNASLGAWSQQRLALAVLDAAGGPMLPAEVELFVRAQSQWAYVSQDSAKFRRHDSPIEVLADGRWAIAAGADAAVATVREAVRVRLAELRGRAALRPDPAAMDARRRAYEQERKEHDAMLAGQSRALLAAFPPAAPRAVAMVDVGRHTVETFIDGELATLRARLSDYEVIGAIDVRALLRALDFDPQSRRLAELGPPQKSITLNRRGRSLKLTPTLLVQGTCRIARPFGDPAKLAGYLASGQLGKLKARLEADAKSLYALHEYGRLHGPVRVRWGFLDEHLPAPWVHWDEPKLYDLKQAALEKDQPLEVVVGSAPGWENPWSRAQRARVVREERGYGSYLVDDDGLQIFDDDVQAARVAGEEVDLPRIGR